MASAQSPAEGPARGGVRLDHDGVRTTVWMWGEHDLSTAGFLATALVEAVAVDDADVVIDLTDVAFMDGSNVEVLLRARQLLARRARRLTLRSPQGLPRKLLEVCGLADLIVSPAEHTPRDRAASSALGTWVEVPAANRPAGAARVVAGDELDAFPPVNATTSAPGALDQAGDGAEAGRFVP